MIYKLLAMLFASDTIPIVHRTVITITGKYSERGYSFTSDDYGKYAFHLTDQYFVSHASKNCTDISQRLRLQGKYNDIENGSMKLTLWTTKELEDLVKKFYIKLIKLIEKDIMKFKGFEQITEFIESIIMCFRSKNEFKKYAKCLDALKKQKNLKFFLN